MNECRIEGCADPILVKSRRLCSAHYTRLMKTGDPETPYKQTRARVPLDERIAATGFDVVDGCHEWRGRLDFFGYPMIKYRQEQVRVHRWSLEQKLGRPLGDKLACHTCDNPCCINPEHLFPGTQADNMADMKRKGRGSTGHRKLTEEQVLLMVQMDGEGGRSRRSIERQFGVSSGTLTRIMNGETWGTVTGIPLKIDSPARKC